MAREKIVRMQLSMLKPVLNGMSLETARKSQDLIGGVMSAAYKSKVNFTPCSVNGRECAWALPFDETRDGVVLYLHGGGYTCGDLEYSKGFGSMLAANCSVKVFCGAYALAPEHPFPAALDDAVAFYDHILERGYGPDRVILCGESAGGGLIYALCLRLRELGKPLPAGIIAISPWTDLTLSGESYKTNLENDPNMTREGLAVFAESYADDLTDPLVSPLFGDLKGLPPSLIFVGSSEILLDDSVVLHQRLTEAGCKSELIVGKDLWHAYVLYALKEHHEQDMARICAFLDSVMKKRRKLRWMKLDNAAKIYPAARSREWSSLFRLSVTLDETVDPVILQSALDVTVRRFPSIAVRLRSGFFWYYLEEIRRAPDVVEDGPYPMRRMPFDDIRSCGFRVLYYRERIAVEFFHSLTDGNGGLVFIKTLAAEYLAQRRSVNVPCEKGVLDRLQTPGREELLDSFPVYAGDRVISRSEPAAYRFADVEREERFLHVVTGTLLSDQLKARASGLGVSVTVYLASVLIYALASVQRKNVKDTRSRLPIVLQIPVNLRKIFPSRTLRNFAYFVNVGIDQRLGEYSFEEILRLTASRMTLEVNDKQLRARFTPNVRSEKRLILKLTPLIIKNVVMKAVFKIVGQRTATMCLSNLGKVDVPSQMEPYVKGMDFLLGAEKPSPYNCGVITYNGKVRISFVRKTVKPLVEEKFFTFLVKDGLKVTVESNQKEEN